MKKYFCVLMLILAVGGCSSSSGVNFDDAKLAKIQYGSTTRQQLISLFGQPTSETPYPENHTLMMWSYSKANAMSTTDGKTLTVQLDNGKVKSYTLSKT
ncbi:MULTISPECIES: hypothetical protein [Erwinia]|uniref:Lipoprotein SmpA/OmlA domain-containing protein n=1 Tax=Erwinia papayae TaxID=206499 RepID=A0ABV3MX96_9GAMM|nr:hypothetical protein [Erwinia mallotivora]